MCFTIRRSLYENSTFNKNKTVSAVDASIVERYIPGWGF